MFMRDVCSCNLPQKRGTAIIESLILLCLTAILQRVPFMERSFYKGQVWARKLRQIKNLRFLTVVIWCVLNKLDELLDKL